MSAGSSSLDLRSRISSRLSHKPRFSWFPTPRSRPVVSQAVRAEALDGDEQREDEEDERHGQAVRLAHAHVRNDRPDHGHRETHRGERGEKRRDAQCAGQDQPERAEHLE